MPFPEAFPDLPLFVDEVAELAGAVRDLLALQFVAAGRGRRGRPAALRCAECAALQRSPRPASHAPGCRTGRAVSALDRLLSPGRLSLGLILSLHYERSPREDADRKDRIAQAEAAFPRPRPCFPAEEERA